MMKWLPAFILAIVQLLTIKAQNDQYEFVKNVNENIEAKYQPCGVDMICVPRTSCNSNNSINTSGKQIINIRSKSRCDYLDKCCHKNNMKKQSTPPRPSIGNSPGCGYRNENGVFYEMKEANHLEAQYSEFPWVVAILRKESYNLVVMECGGSIITPFIVLTAAHCVNGKDPSILTVRAGEWDMETTSEVYPHQVREVKEIIQHHLFDNESLIFDMALLILKEPLVLDFNVQPICLPSIDQDFDGSRCFVAGWGKHKFGRNGRYQQILKKIDIPMVPWEKCQNLLRKTRLQYFFELDESFICAGGERGQDACTGDGGSPLVCRIPGSNERYFQAGIVSWGIGCGEQDVPGVYANTLYMLPWLTEKLSQQRADKNYFSALL